MTSEKRAERRRAQREAERKRDEELERVLEEPKLAPFEKPASGRIVEKPKDSPKKK